MSQKKKVVLLMMWKRRRERRTDGSHAVDQNLVLAEVPLYEIQ
jgi:hypothetical protein